MSVFPPITIDRLSTILKELGYINRDHWDDLLRFDIITRPDVTIFLSAKIPINLPIPRPSPRLAPAELVSFQCSFGFRLRELNESAEIVTNYLATFFKDTIAHLKSYKHEFNFTEEVEKRLLNFIAHYWPEPSANNPELIQSDNKITVYIRDHLLNNLDPSDPFHLRLSQDVQDCYQFFHLSPTTVYPHELNGGIPAGRENAIIFFCNSNFNDYLVEEPGCVTYWRDYQYKNVWIRTSLLTYSPYLLYAGITSYEYRYNYLLYDWIVYCRALISQLVPILDAPLFPAADLAPYSVVPLLQENLSKMVSPGIFVSPLVAESIKSDKAKPSKIPDTTLFESTPQSLEELSVLHDCATAQLLSQQGKYSQAQQHLLQARRKLKKYHHTFGLTQILIRLADLYINAQLFRDAINPLEEALELAHTGKIPLPIIVRIQMMLVYVHGLVGNKENSERHFDTILKFIRSLPNEPDTERLLAQSYLGIIKTQIACKQYKETEGYFKEIHKIVSKYPVYEFLFYYYRAQYYAGIGNTIKQIEALETAIDISEGPDVDYLEAIIALAIHYVAIKADPSKIMQLLNRAEKMDLYRDVESFHNRIAALKKEVLEKNFHRDIEQELETKWKTK